MGDHPTLFEGDTYEGKGPHEGHTIYVRKVVPRGYKIGGGTRYATGQNVSLECVPCRERWTVFERW